MNIEIIGDADRTRLYCTGSFTKMMTTFVSLSFFSEKYILNDILDDDHFFDTICANAASREFLNIFQHIIGSKFSLRDVCSFYNGLPYTFDLSASELERVDQGQPYQHHGIMDEQTFLTMCRTCVTQIDPNHSKFHYSEIAIIFLGYLIEKIYDVKFEDLYKKYLLDAFELKASLFSRTKPDNVYVQDLSDLYDYPSITIQDHGYFCYSNGFYTTLNDQKKLLEQLLLTPVFAAMSDITKARAASNRLMSGMTLEIRKVDDDILYGYEGLSYSGCNIWVYSTKYKKGYLTTTNDEDGIYDVIYGLFGYSEFDKVPEHTQEIYQAFLKNTHYEFESKPIPADYVGSYQRVNMNGSKLETIFTVGEHNISIRNPAPVTYDVIYDHGIYRITCKDGMHGTKVGFYQAKSGNHYMQFDGSLFKKIT